MTLETKFQVKQFHTMQHLINSQIFAIGKIARQILHIVHIDHARIEKVLSEGVQL